MTTRDETRRKAIAEAAARVASGEWSLTPEQLAVVRKMEAGRKAAAEERVPAAKRVGSSPDQIRGAIKELIRRIKDFEDRIKVVEGRVNELLGQTTLREAGGKAALAAVGEQAMLKKLAEVEAKDILAAADRLISEAIKETPEGTPERRALRRMRDEARKGKLP